MDRTLKADIRLSFGNLKNKKKQQKKKHTKKQQQKKTEQNHPFPDYLSHENLKNERNSVILLLDHYRGHPRGQFGRKKSP